MNTLSNDRRANFNAVKKAVRLVKFGIELETCPSAGFDKMKLFLKKRSDELKNTKIPTNGNRKVTLEDLPSLQWQYIEDSDIEDYSKWTLTSDLSVSCGSYVDKSDPELYHCVYGRDPPKNIMNVKNFSSRVKKCNPEEAAAIDSNVNDNQIEFVTPILSMSKRTKALGDVVNDSYESGEGFVIFTLVWNWYILGSPKLNYVANSSQGLHVNISHPLLNNLKSVKNLALLWMVFEPLFFEFVGQKRREEGLNEFTLPLRTANLYNRGADKLTSEHLEYIRDKNYKNVKELMDDITRKPVGANYGYKYSTLNMKALLSPDPKKRRVEVRVYSGSMDYIEIYNWSLLCIIFVTAGLLITKGSIPSNIIEMRSKDHIPSLFHMLFDSIIFDTRLKRYFGDLYNKRKDSDSPHILIHKEPDIVMFPLAVKDLNRRMKTHI